tara:strand:+ start:54 stop:275 length:222 start_codon:yes stop_codon:yes gene_type:complete
VFCFKFILKNKKFPDNSLFNREFGKPAGGKFHKEKTVEKSVIADTLPPAGLNAHHKTAQKAALIKSYSLYLMD